MSKKSTRRLSDLLKLEGPPLPPTPPRKAADYWERQWNNHWKAGRRRKKDSGR